MIRLLRWLRLAFCLSLLPAAATIAAPIEFRFLTSGRIQSGDVILATTSVVSFFTVDSTDLDPLLDNGAYGGTAAPYIQIGDLGARPAGGTVAAFTNRTPNNHTVQFILQLPAGSVSFFGRDLQLVFFTFVDCCSQPPDMLLSDALPVDMSFINLAQFAQTDLYFSALPGDPFYVPGGLTRFTVCDQPLPNCFPPSAILAIPEPPTPLLVLVGVMGLMFWRARQTHL